MMNLIMLPGNNWRNKEWTQEVEKLVKGDFDQTWMQIYENWGIHADLMDPDKEVKKLVQKAKNFGEYVIFAKSAGTLLVMRAVTEFGMKPVKCFFVGTAIRWGLEQNWPVEKWVKGYNIPTLFIQKTDDPIMTFGELRHELEKSEVKNYKLVEIPGASHHYGAVYDLKSRLREWVKEKVKSDR